MKLFAQEHVYWIRESDQTFVIPIIDIAVVVLAIVGGLALVDRAESASADLRRRVARSEQSIMVVNDCRR